MKHGTHCPSCTDAQCWGDQKAAVLRTRVAALEAVVSAAVDVVAYVDPDACGAIERLQWRLSELKALLAGKGEV